MKNYFLGLLLLLVGTIDAQNEQTPYTPSAQRLEGFQQRKSLIEQSIVNNIPFRNVGPTIMSGRVSDVDVNPDDPSIFYVAYASGGLWKTVSNGSEFSPLFDNESVMTIGDIAVNWKNNIIWVGTGEVNSSRSSYSGNGVYKSIDGGKTWQNTGLGETHHIGRVVLHPTNPDIVWVAALGHLYSPNIERGVFKTTDGGKTWRQTLKIDDNTGVVDMLVDANNPDILYAAAWQRERRAWNFEEGGKGSGIYRSNDGGETWSLITTEGSGFPIGEGSGRIGITLAQKDGKNYLYAVIDNQNNKPPKEEVEPSDDLTIKQFRKISKEDFLKLDSKKIEKYLRNNEFPEKYKAETVIKMVKEDKIKPSDLADYLENADNDLFETEVIGAELYLSTDDGKKWTKVNTDYLDGLHFTYGYYFSQVRTLYNNPDKIYIIGFQIIKSEDGGKTFKTINQENVHVDHHALWIDPNRAGHLINGNDGGINISYDDGKTWFKCNAPPVGQFYSVNTDNAEPYNVYGGLQDNGVWTGPSNYKPNLEWQGSGQYPFKEIMGGDGMQVAVDARDNNTIYSGYQFGNYFRINKSTGDNKYITPKPDLGEKALRFNWQTPIMLSKHSQNILYIGANKLYRSLDQGNNWECISDDLTKGGKKGNVPYGTLTSIHESPLKFGLLYTGSDDGMVYVSKDGGFAWNNISAGLPNDMWVSRIQASQYDKATVYVALNGYRWDDFNPYLYISKDYGQNWTMIGGDLPKEPINVVKEDPQNENILYVGTDHGLYVSLNKGTTFMSMNNKDLPNVSVHDLVIQPNAHDIVLGTHGRSIYIASVKQLQQMRDSVLMKNIYVFEMDTKKYNQNWGKQFSKFEELKEPETFIPVYSKNAGKVTIQIQNEKGLVLKKWQADCNAGINYLSYHFDIDENIVKKYEQFLNDNKDKEAKNIVLKKADSQKYYLNKGKYNVIVEMNGSKDSKTWVIE